MYKGKILPPVYLLICLGLQFLASIAFPIFNFRSRMAIASAIVLFLFGAGWLLLSAILFRRRKTTIMPFQESSYLISSGPFKRTRNPIYLAMFFVSLGFSLLLGAFTALAFPFLFYLVIDRKIIPHEEAMLEDSFGEDYINYKKKVPRWI